MSPARMSAGALTTSGCRKYQSRHVYWRIRFYASHVSDHTPWRTDALRSGETTYEAVKLVKDLKHAVVAALLIFHRFQVLAISEVDRPVDQVKLVLRNAYAVICSSQ
jgi:hypothetical protein